MPEPMRRVRPAALPSTGVPPRRAARTTDSPSAAASIRAVAVLATLLVSAGSSADPIVYQVDKTLAMHAFNTDNHFVYCNDDAGGLAQVPLGSECPVLTLTGTITTDGTLGGWEITEHLVALDLNLSNGTNSAQLDTFEGWLFAEDGTLFGIAAEGPGNTRFSDPISGAGWIGSAFQRGGPPYEQAYAFGGAISGLLRDWTSQRPYAPLGVAVPEPTPGLLIGLGLLMLGLAPRTPSGAKPRL